MAGPGSRDASSLPGIARSQGSGSIASNAGFALAAQVATAVFTAGVTIFLVRYLGPEEFGVFSLALGVGLLLVLPSDFGISQSTSRFVAEESQRGDPAAILADGLRLKLIVTGAVAVALFGLAEPIADAYGVNDLVWPLRGMAIALIGQGVMFLFSGAFIALQRNSTNFQAIASESAVEAGATIGLVLLGAGASGAAFGRAIGFGFGALFAALLAVRLLGPRVMAIGSGSGSGRRIATYAGALFVIDGAYTVLGQIDVLLIGGFLTATAVGLFQAPWRLSLVLSYPGLALSAAIAPRLAHGLPEKDPESAEAFGSGLRLLMVFQAALVAPLVVWADPITDLVLGADFEESAEVLRALAPYVFLAGFAPLVSNAVDYLGEARRRIPIAVLTLAVNAIIDIILIPEIGIVAGAIGTTAGFLVYVPGHLWLCDRLIGLPLRSLAVSFARCLLGAAAMAGVLLAFGTNDLSAIDWVAGGLGALAVYVAVLFATRELTADRLREDRAIMLRS